MAWAYGAGFDRGTEQHLEVLGLALHSEFMVRDLIKLVTLRRPAEV
jgi:hypothetical protein